MTKPRPPRLLEDDKGRLYIVLNGKKLEIKSNSMSDDWCKQELCRLVLKRRVVKKRRPKKKKVREAGRPRRPRRRRRRKVERAWDIFRRPIEVYIRDNRGGRVVRTSLMRQGNK